MNNKLKISRDTPLTPEQSKLVEENYKLVYWVINQKRRISKLNLDDSTWDIIHDELVDTFFQCVRLYKPELGKISTYITTCLFRACSRSLTKQGKHWGKRKDIGDNIDLEDFSRETDKEVDEQLEFSEDIQRAMEKHFPTLHPRTQDILSRYFGFRGYSPQTTREIGIFYGCTHQNIWSKINSAILVLQAKMGVRV